MSTKHALIKELFQVDEKGQPLPLFEIKIGKEMTPDGLFDRKPILELSHSNYAYGLIKSIDDEVNRLMDGIGQATSNLEAEKVVQDCLLLSEHAKKLAYQAYFLDTADRNYWVTLDSLSKVGPNEVLGVQAKTLESLCHGNLKPGQHPALPGEAKPAREKDDSPQP